MSKLVLTPAQAKSSRRVRARLRTIADNVSVAKDHLSRRSWPMRARYVCGGHAIHLKRGAPLHSRWTLRCIDLRGGRARLGFKGPRGRGAWAVVDDADL